MKRLQLPRWKVFGQIKKKLKIHWTFILTCVWVCAWKFHHYQRHDGKWSFKSLTHDDIWRLEILGEESSRGENLMILWVEDEFTSISVQWAPNFAFFGSFSNFSV